MGKLKVYIISLVLFTSGCGIQFEEITIANLKFRWEDATRNAAVSWWYLGENKDNYFIIENNLLKTIGYKVKKTDVHIVVTNPHELTFDRSLWINIKKGMLKNARDGIEW